MEADKRNSIEWTYKDNSAPDDNSDVEVDNSLNHGFNADAFEKAVTSSLETLEYIKNLAAESLSHFYENSGIKELLDYLHSLPKDVKGSWAYQEAMSLETRKDVQLEDVLWIPGNFDLSSLRVAVDNIKELDDENHFTSDMTESYVISIINSKRIPKREKLVLLLSHMESLIYDAMGKMRQKRERVKDQTKKYVSGKDKFNMDAVEAIYVLAITNVVFSNTDSYDKPIDHRLPFRNNILHRGIVDYNDQEIKSAYAYLVECIAILLLTIAQKKSGVWEQKVFSLDESK